MSPDEKLRRAERAKQIMDDPLVQEALGIIEGVVRDRFWEIPADRADEFKSLCHVRELTKRFRGVFQHVMAEGKLTRHDLERPYGP